MYQLTYHPHVIKKLKKLHPIDRKKTIEKLEQVAKNPKDTALNIKKLVNTEKSYRLRIGTIRAIFTIEEEIKTIYIWDIDYRGSIY